jgi:hypothetical protein
MGDGILSLLRHTLWAVRDCELKSAMGDAQNLQLLLVGRGLCCRSGDVCVCVCVCVCVRARARACFVCLSTMLLGGAKSHS